MLRTRFERWLVHRVCVSYRYHYCGSVEVFEKNIIVRIHWHRSNFHWPRRCTRIYLPLVNVIESSARRRLRTCVYVEQIWFADTMMVGGSPCIKITYTRTHTHTCTYKHMQTRTGPAAGNGMLDCTQYHARYRLIELLRLSRAMPPIHTIREYRRRHYIILL
jgi:hypothetical protein